MSSMTAAVGVRDRATHKGSRLPMTAARKAAIAVGVLFLTATATYVVGSALISSAMSVPHQLSSLNTTQIQFGVFLEVINVVCNVSIGVLLLPILRQYHERLAIGYLATRIIESVLLLVSALCVLMLLPIAQEYVGSGAANASQLATLATLATQGYHLAFQLGEIALGVGALALCYILYQARLVPRPLAVLGFVGYLALFASGWLYIAGQHGIAPVLYIPGGTFEFILPLWLIIKGFREPAPIGHGPGEL